MLLLILHIKGLHPDRNLEVMQPDQHSVTNEITLLLDNQTQKENSIRAIAERDPACEIGGGSGGSIQLNSTQLNHADLANCPAVLYIYIYIYIYI